MSSTSSYNTLSVTTIFYDQPLTIHMTSNVATKVVISTFPPSHESKKSHGHRSRRKSISRSKGSYQPADILRPAQYAPISQGSMYSSRQPAPAPVKPAQKRVTFDLPPAAPSMHQRLRRMSRPQPMYSSESQIQSWRQSCE